MFTLRDFIVQCYGIDESKATIYAGLPSAFSLFLSPLSGYIMDKFDIRLEASACAVHAVVATAPHRSVNGIEPLTRRLLPR